MRRFQFHLTTLMAVVFTAAVLMWLNLTERAPGIPFERLKLRYAALELPAYGWPLPYSPIYIICCGREEYITAEPGCLTTIVLIDVAVALFILALVWWLSEWWARRRDRGNSSVK